jgi:tyrosine-specific transport protein
MKNLRLPEGANLISMAKKTLGKPGAALTWIINLLLFYALLSAYITGGAQVTQNWLSALHAPFSLAAILFTLVMATVVLKGVYWVDHTNRALMTIKGTALILLILTILPNMQSSFARFGTPHTILSATTVMITSFGYASIIPSLRALFKEDIASLKKAIVIGSVIPLFIYIIWNISVHSALPSAGPLSLIAMHQSGNASSQLAIALSSITQSTSIKILSHTFTSICVFTSFLGVGLALSDFIADGTGLSKNNRQGCFIVGLLTFFLPFCVAIFFPRAFIVALSYAGILCIILLMLLPILMAWRARVVLADTENYRVFGEQKLIVVAFLLSIATLVLSIVFF